MSDPTQFSAPGVPIEHTQGTPAPIAPAETSVALFVGPKPGPPRLERVITSFAQYLALPDIARDDLLAISLDAFFLNGGRRAAALWLPRLDAASLVAAIEPGGVAGDAHFNLLCAPGLSNVEAILALQTLCRARRAFFIVDAPQDDDDVAIENTAGRLSGPDSRNAALYFPWLRTASGVAPPCGFVAGIYARTDMTRGVWKAPAGTDATLNGAVGLALEVSNQANERLNPKSVNCLRSFPAHGIVVWGARTLQQNDLVWRYVPVRRLTLFLEESIDKGLDWTVFEPNAEPLWTRVRDQVGNFLAALFRQGAFQGNRQDEAFFVICDRRIMTQDDIDNGRLFVEIGFAPTRPAEFVILRISKFVTAPPA